ncbi:MAG: hypothetical protein IBX64_13040 [Actinobacteria bacterium]|nr:hypothetical protein [Actinomycetota bacterium]
MRKLDIQYFIYMVGIITFGVFYYELKAEFENQWIFVGAAIAYLASIRLVGYLAGKWQRSIADRNK